MAVAARHVVRVLAGRARQGGGEHEAAACAKAAGDGLRGAAKAGLRAGAHGHAACSCVYDQDRVDI